VSEVSKLRVYNLACELTMQVYQVTEGFPGPEKFRLTDQFIRSVSSISANIAEGYNRMSEKEKRRFFYTALASAEEAKHHLLLAKNLRYLSEQESSKLETTLCIVIGMLRAFINRFDEAIERGERYEP